MPVLAFALFHSSVLWQDPKNSAVLVLTSLRYAAAQGTVHSLVKGLSCRLVAGEATAGNLSEHITPGRTDGKGGIDEPDVRVGLRKIAALDFCGGQEMLGE